MKYLCFVSDFEREIICSPPFQKVNNVGCVKLFREKDHHTQLEGMAHCQSLGGELFEFNDFDQQNQDVFNYLISNEGKPCIIITWVIIQSHPIHLSTVAIDKADIWIGLKKAKNGNNYWPISGTQVGHRERQNIWNKRAHFGKQDCVHMNLPGAKHVKNSFFDYPCIAPFIDSLCYVPLA